MTVVDNRRNPASSAYCGSDDDRSPVGRVTAATPAPAPAKAHLRRPL